MKYAYFPGCSLEGTARDFGESAEAVCHALGIDFQVVPDWVCCGATPAHSYNEALGTALSVRTMVNAKQVSNRMMVLCASCYNRCKMSNEAMKTRPELRAKVEDAVGESYAGDVEVMHLLEILDRDYGLEQLKAKMVRSLAGLKVACYYGCLLVRPPKIMKLDDPENPTIMERVIATTGIEPVENWSHKVECCGAGLAMARTDVVNRCVNDIVASARAAGAEALVVACPLCQANCDMRQAVASAAAQQMPTLYFTQVLGLALGLPPKTLGLHRLMISADKLLDKLAIKC